MLDFRQTYEFVKDYNISSIIHAAGFVGGIGLHKKSPGQVALKNLRMGLNIIEACSLIDNISLVTISTVCAYPETAPVPSPESSLHDGYPSPITAYYGIAKKTLHVLSEAVSKEYNFKYLNIIPTNLYGPNDHYGESKSHVVPALIQRAHLAKINGDAEFVAWGDGSQVRDLLYAPDAAHWIRMIMESGINNESFNIGSRLVLL